ncbi:MAG: hypothetical protein K5989_10070, partial [Lachnospiraceae bacterium]|nr:hypothetical protein [Lachnospiraceae bacterium]
MKTRKNLKGMTALWLSAMLAINSAPLAAQTAVAGEQAVNETVEPDDSANMKATAEGNSGQGIGVGKTSSSREDVEGLKKGTGSSKASLTIGESERKLGMDPDSRLRSSKASLTIGESETEYTSFSEAVTAWCDASGSPTLKLLDNVEIDKQITVSNGSADQPRILNLNGYGIRVTGDSAFQLI